LKIDVYANVLQTPEQKNDFSVKYLGCGVDGSFPENRIPEQQAERHAPASNRRIRPVHRERWSAHGGGERRGHIVSPRAQLVHLIFARLDDFTIFDHTTLK